MSRKLQFTQLEAQNTKTVMKEMDNNVHLNIYHINCTTYELLYKKKRILLRKTNCVNRSLI